MNEWRSGEAERISNELRLVNEIVTQVQSDWEKFVRTGDDAYLKATAYDLHGFYTGLEKIFKTVAGSIDNEIPTGETWHKDLIEQMTKEFPEIRPGLISVSSRELLDEYLRFRHRIRNIYSFNIVPTLVRDLIQKLPSIFSQIKT